MTPELLRQVLCSAFRISQEADSLLVHTPFGLDFNDDLVLRVRPDGVGFRIDDNGDTWLALSMAGASLDADRINELIGGVEFDVDDGSLIARSKNSLDVADALFKVVGATLRVHGACRPRPRPQPSDFKERVVTLLAEVAKESGVPLALDQMVEETGSLMADAVLGIEKPLVFVVATSVERLMEAELLFLRRQITRRAGYVCAVVPSAKSIGTKHFSRANYYTDKTLEFDGWAPAFKEFAQQQLAIH